MKRLFNNHPVLTVIILMLVTLSPLMALRDCSPSNELRYLSIVDEALSEGNVFAFTCQGEDYADKPPFYFWLMMLSKLLFGEHNMYVLMLLSFIPACVIIAVMDKWLRREYPDRFSPAQRAAAALMLATAGLFLGMSVFLRMDMMMCMWIVLALWTFWKMDTGSTARGGRFLLPFYTFMALFTKGPVGILVPPLAIIVYLICGKRGRDIGKYLGWSFWGILAAFCAVWFTGVYLDGGKEYLTNLLFHQTYGRAVNSFHHKAPVWYYFGIIWGVLAPWCLAVIPSVVTGLLKKGDAAPTRFERFCALTVITTFVMLSCFSSKLAIYLAPLFSFAVYLYPAVLERRGWSRWQGFATGFPAALLTVLGLAVAGVSLGCLLLPKVPDILDYPFLKSPLFLTGGVVMVVGGLRAFEEKIRAKDAWWRPVICVSVFLLTAVFVISFKTPTLNDYIGYGNLCKLVPPEGEVYTLRVRRPESMDVYLGREIYSFDKDIDSFLLLAPKEGTLILPVSALGESDALMEYLEHQEFKFCGPYAVYHLDKKVTATDEVLLGNKKARGHRRRQKS